MAEAFGDAPTPFRGQAISTLRALIQSRRFDSAWELSSGAYRREIDILDNVAPFPCERADGWIDFGHAPEAIGSYGDYRADGKIHHGPADAG